MLKRLFILALSLMVALPAYSVLAQKDRDKYMLMAAGKADYMDL